VLCISKIVTSDSQCSGNSMGSTRRHASVKK
jgi:hypothetical protein